MTFDALETRNPRAGRKLRSPFAKTSDVMIWVCVCACAEVSLRVPAFLRAPFSAWLKGTANGNKQSPNLNPYKYTLTCMFNLLCSLQKDLIAKTPVPSMQQHQSLTRACCSLLQSDSSPHTESPQVLNGKQSSSESLGGMQATQYKTGTRVNLNWVVAFLSAERVIYLAFHAKGQGQYHSEISTRKRMQVIIPTLPSWV